MVSQELPHTIEEVYSPEGRLSTSPEDIAEFWEKFFVEPQEKYTRVRRVYISGRNPNRPGPGHTMGGTPMAVLERESIKILESCYLHCGCGAEGAPISYLDCRTCRTKIPLTCDGLEDEDGEDDEDDDGGGDGSSS